MFEESSIASSPMQMPTPDAAFAAAQSQLKEQRRIVQGDVKYKERLAEERRRQSELE